MNQQINKNEEFGWIVVGKDPVQDRNKKLVPNAYMIGTWFQCAKYQLQHGIRSTTDIIPF